MYKTIIIATVSLCVVIGICVVFSFPKNTNQNIKVETTSQVSSFEQLQKISFQESEPLKILESIKPDPPLTEPLKTSYSPGNKEWATPTKEDTKEWKMQQWKIAVLKWAEPKLDVWYCCSCKDRFGKNSRFIRTGKDYYIFKHKCKCDYDHTIKLKHGLKLKHGVVHGNHY